MIKCYQIFIYIVSVSATLVLNSCVDDPHDSDFELSGDVEKYFPSYSVSLNVSYNMSNKYFHMTAEPHFYFVPSEWGLVVDKVEYYVDDVYIRTETKSPYAVTYESNNWSVGSHNIRADITISGKNIKTFVLQTTKVIGNYSN